MSIADTQKRFSMIRELLNLRPVHFLSFLIFMLSLGIFVFFYKGHYQYSISLVGGWVAVVGFVFAERSHEIQQIEIEESLLLSRLDKVIEGFSYEFERSLIKGDIVIEQRSGTQAILEFSRFLQQNHASGGEFPKNRIDMLNAFVSILGRIVILYNKSGDRLNERKVVFYMQYYILIHRVQDIYEVIKKLYPDKFNELQFEQVLSNVNWVIQDKEDTN